MVTPREGVTSDRDGPLLSGGSLFASDYHVVRPLSAGGMGTVYVARQASTGKDRALKVMHPQLVADASLRERFEREARIVSLIESDHVVQVIGAGVDGGSGSPWLAMELLEGEDLDAFMTRRGTVSPSELLEVFRQLCHALGAAHVVGVVHRDLKPENIFLTVAPNVEMTTRVKVLDFGIAKVLADAGHSTATLGTPLWMAPEQTDPRADIRASADVWSLGLLGFWMLTGHLFWSCVNNPNVSVQAMMRELLFEPIPEASERAAELGCADRLPPGFDAWFARCVVREPERRFPDANAAESALRAAMPGVTLGPLPFHAPSDRDPSGARATSMRPMVTGRLLETTDASYAREEPPTARKRPPPWFAIAAGALGAVLVVGIGVALATGYIRIGAPAEPAPVAELATSRPDPAPVPVVTAVATIPAPPPDPSTEPLPVVTSTVVKTPSSARPLPALKKRPPFDVSAAHESLARAAGNAKFACKDRAGPRAIAFDVTFNAETGNVRHALPKRDFASHTALCAQMMLGAAHVKPFEPPDQKVSTTVGLD